MRTPTERLLNAVQRPDAYREVLIRSAAAPIVLSVWDGRPDLPVVVFLPGTMTHPLFYEDFLDALNRAGVTAVGVHSQGHGKSPRVRRPLLFATLVTNARDAVAWARAEFPGRPVAVIGSSQGGVVAMALAAGGERLDAVLAHNVLGPVPAVDGRDHPLPGLDGAGVFERESFGALHQMMGGLDEAARERTWARIAGEVEQFEGPDGFVAPGEMLVVGAVNPG